MPGLEGGVLRTRFELGREKKPTSTLSAQGFGPPRLTSYDATSTCGPVGLAERIDTTAFVCVDVGGVRQQKKQFVYCASPYTSPTGAHPSANPSSRPPKVHGTCS